MPIWAIPITLVEYGRDAIVEADTLTEAIGRLRACAWDELTDPNRFKVTKVGAAREVTPEELEGGTREKWSWNANPRES